MRKIQVRFDPNSNRQIYTCPECGHSQPSEFPIFRYQRTTYGRREITYKCPKCACRIAGW